MFFVNVRRLRLFLLIVAALAVAAGVVEWTVIRAPAEPHDPPLVLNDVSRLNPIAVAAIATPTSTQQIADAVRAFDGPISIGGARHSMGGQIATAGGLHLDTRRLDAIVDFAPEQKTVTVQAGVRWRQIQERIDPANLSVAIMQSYANFTVGGSLSVNVHGRYVGRGPIISSVKAVKVVLADGSVVEASPTSNAEIFNGVIGGYGGLGVITEATLDLVENVRLIRRDTTVPIADYRRYFVDQVLAAPAAVLHNGDAYPPAYETVHAVTYSKTDGPVTVTDRLVPWDATYRLNRFVYWVVSEWPFGKPLRQHVIDPMLYRDEPVTWLNYEASYDARELEPASRASTTYVLTECFVPVDQFEAFVPRLRDVLQRHDVNVINVSVRHARRDPGSILAWAKTDVFAFVIYYKQGTSSDERARAGIWTRELIDAALNLGGSYYLPYQLHATLRRNNSSARILERLNSSRSRGGSIRRTSSEMRCGRSTDRMRVEIGIAPACA